MTLREQFLEDGFVHVPGALDADTLRIASACWNWSLEHPGPASARLFQDALVLTEDLDAARKVSGSESGFFYQDIGNRHSLSAYQSLLNSDDLRSLLSLLLEQDRAWFLGEQIFLKEPNTPATGWHQDLSDVSASGDDLVVLWIPFDAVDAETSLALVRGSHRGPIYSSIYGRYEAGDIPRVDQAPEQFDIVAFPCEPGDVVAFHLGCLHGGAPTRADQTRRTLALRFIGTDCSFDSRTQRDDPRNGAPYQRDHLAELRLA